MRNRRIRSSLRAISASIALSAVTLAASQFVGAMEAERPIASAGGRAPSGWNGWLQFGAAYTYASPARLSQFRGRAEVAGRGTLGDSVRWKLSVRAGYDAAFDLTDFYVAGVRRDQRAELALREAYVDFSKGDWEFRIGKQNVVWGEMVGLFFADVVSAKDLREFVLPEFEQVRIPQWAARAEWFKNDTHLEFVWLPAPAIDRIGEPGAEFYPFPFRYDGIGYVIDRERKPSRSIANGGFGARTSTMVDGWDLAAFVYRAPDSAPTFYRSLIDGPAPVVQYQARHDRITRVGGTLARDFDGVVAKAEVVYTTGRRFSTVPLDAGSGVVRLDTLDWIAGLDFTPADDWRVNAQFFQRAFLDHDPATGFKRYENGTSVMVSHSLASNLDAEVLAISSLSRSDWMLRAALIWKTGRASRVRVGLDAFGGQPIGLFGRFDARDRGYAEVRYSF